MAGAAVACARFSQNAWRREMCANCFKAKTEHAAPPPRPPAPPADAQPQHSILKGVGKRPERKAKRTNVGFHKEESEIIGYDGGDDDFEGGDDFEVADGKNADLPDTSFPELSDAEDKELQNVTRKNTDYNSENANLLMSSPPPKITQNGVTIQNGNSGSKITVSITNTVTNGSKSKAEPLELGKKKHKSMVPIVSVTPFGSKPTAICAPTPKAVAPTPTAICAPTPKAVAPSPTAICTPTPKAAAPTTKAIPTPSKVASTPIPNAASTPIPKATQISTPKAVSAPTPKAAAPPRAAPSSIPKAVAAPKSVQAPTPTAVCAPTPKERIIAPAERKPPLGHEDTSAPLTAPALVKLQAKEPVKKEVVQKEVVKPEPVKVEPERKKPEAIVVKIEVPPKPVEEEEEVNLSLTPSDSDASTLSEDEAKKPKFFHHKDSVDLISPPRSPLLKTKHEERPVPIGKVASDLSIALKNNAVNAAVYKKSEFEKRKKNGAKLSEARSSALIRRWTVGERVLIQPRRPIMDAPEIVPLTLTTKQGQLEPRELSGEPDGEDSSEATVDHKPQVEEKPEEVIKPVEKVEEMMEIDLAVEEPIVVHEVMQVESKIVVDKPPTPPSSPLPDEDLPPMLPNTPPPVLQVKTPPARPTSTPGAGGARSSFLHTTMLGRPQVPVKPTSLMLANVSSSGRRHQTTPVAVAVPSPVTPVKEEIQKTFATPMVETPKAPLCEVECFETPKSSFTPSTGGKPPILSPRPKLGSYKKRQAPKPPKEEQTGDARTPSEELSRRDSITSVDKVSLQSKKNAGRFSLRRLLRIGSKEERPTSPDSWASPPSMPSSPESPNRPEIIHPSNLDGRQVEVVSRMLHPVETSPASPTSPTVTTPPGPSSITSTTPPARPRPPPPPRTMSLPQSPSQRPARPPPPQSVQLLQMREQASDQKQNQPEDSIYANLDSVKCRNAATPSKPHRTGSMRESPEKASPANEEGDYETVQFGDGKTIKRRRSVILGSMEENYGAVVGANHRALAQLLSVLMTTPLPSEVSSVSVPCYAGECRNLEEKSLVVLQILMELRKMLQLGATSASLDQFRIIRPKDPSLSEIGPRVESKDSPCAVPAAMSSVAIRVCQLLVPSDSVLPPLLEANDLQRAVTYLELKTWGPEVAPVEREVALQRWLDLERATSLQSLAQNRSANRMAIAQEMFVNFLVQASAVSLAQATKLV